jgi:hypothetical protein
MQDEEVLLFAIIIRSSPCKMSIVPSSTWSCYAYPVHRMSDDDSEMMFLEMTIMP